MARATTVHRRFAAINMSDKLNPPSAARQDDIVQEIVDNLRPWRDHKGESTVTAEVKRTLNTVLEISLSAKFLSYRKSDREHAKNLDKALRQVEILMPQTPEHLACLLFFPAERGDHLFRDPFELGRLIEELKRISLKRFNLYLYELKELREQCAGAQSITGYHPNYNYVKHLCASGAHRLLRALSAQGKITGAKNKPFWIITSLLYEAVSGKRTGKTGVKRACDNVLRKMRPPRVSEKTWRED